MLISLNAMLCNGRLHEANNDSEKQDNGQSDESGTGKDGQSGRIGLHPDDLENAAIRNAGSNPPPAIGKGARPSQQPRQNDLFES